MNYACEQPVRRKKAVRILKDLPRQTRVVDLPEDQKACDCCGERLRHFADECSEHLHYVPSQLIIIETRRKKYAAARATGRSSVPRLRGRNPWTKGWRRRACWPF